MGWNAKAPKTFRDTTAVRTFNVPRGDSAKGEGGGGGDSSGELSIYITEPDLKAHGLSLETWAASSVQASLMQRLTESQVSFPPEMIAANRGAGGSPGASTPQTVIPILELGAGTGMVGISAAARYALPAVLTDLGPIAPGLAANIALNRGSLSGTPVLSATLDWSRPGDLAFYHPPPVPPAADGCTPPRNPFEEGAAAAAAAAERRRRRRAHLVLAADTIYSDEHPPLLAAAVLRWLRRDDPAARLVMCLPLRACYLEELRDLWRRLEAGGLECVEDGQEMADEDTFDDECLCEWSIWRWKEGEREIRRE